MSAVIVTVHPSGQVLVTAKTKRVTLQAANPVAGALFDMLGVGQAALGPNSPAMNLLLDEGVLS